MCFVHVHAADWFDYARNRDSLKRSNVDNLAALTAVMQSSLNISDIETMLEPRSVIVTIKDIEIKAFCSPWFNVWCFFGG